MRHPNVAYAHLHAGIQQNPEQDPRKEHTGEHRLGEHRLGEHSFAPDLSRNRPPPPPPPPTYTPLDPDLGSRPERSGQLPLARHPSSGGRPPATTLCTLIALLASLTLGAAAHAQNTLRIAPVAGNGVTISSSDARQGEIAEDAASGAVTLAVTLFTPSTEVVTVAYATADFSSTDTAVLSSSIDPATAGADYTAASGTLTFAAGETRKTITVAINDDVNRERDELFKVGLSNATGGAVIASSGSEAIIFIVDDDPLLKATITASVPGLTNTGAPGATNETPEGFLSVAEGDSGNTDIIFTVTLEGTDYVDITFAVESTDGSATGNEDYRNVGSRSLPVFVDIAAGQTTGTFTLSVFGDENYEPDETMFLEFNNSRGVNITNSADGFFRVEVTITNDDAVMATSASNLQARPAGSGNLAVSWAPAFGAPNGYSVRWRKASESDTALSAVNTVTATSYTITGLDNDTSYHVRLDTRNLANDGIASGTSLTTAATPPRPGQRRR